MVAPSPGSSAPVNRKGAVLRTCVHCGFCTATCPTFVLLGDELDSPRGRIYLIKDMLETGRPATEEVVRHVDRCLTCLSCMTTCPSGVNYMHLVDHARTYIEQTYRRPLPERLLRSLLGVLLPRPRLFRLALMGARVTRPLGRLIPGQSMLAQRLRAMLAMTPPSVPAASPTEKPQVYPAEGVRKARVVLLAGCAQQVLMPRLKSDLLTALLAARDGKLQSLEWRDEVALTVVMASKGYPGAYEKGHVITGLDAAAKLPGVTIFHAGTAPRGSDIVTVGGRVLDVTAVGKTIAEAQGRAYAAVDLIHWEGAFCRRDIGWRALTR